MTANDPTAAAYQATVGGPLEVDRKLYARIHEDPRKELVQKFEIPIRSGQAWHIPAGHLCRIVTTVGPQVGDLNLWNAHDPRERLWAARTRQLQAAHVTVFDRLWSNLPFLRPLVTITGDSLKDYGQDAQGGRVHDLLGTRCDPYVHQILTGEAFHFCCHSNLVRAVLPHGLTEFDVHDVLNVFQCTGLNHDDKYYMKSAPTKKRDYFEFFSEIDVLAALSVCPGGDLSVPLWGPDAKDPISVCRPLGVEVYKVHEDVLKDWKPPARAAYSGLHGLTAKSWPATAQA